MVKESDISLSLIQDSESASEGPGQSASADPSQEATNSKKGSSTQRYAERHQYCIDTVLFNCVLNRDFQMKSSIDGL